MTRRRHVYFLRIRFACYENSAAPAGSQTTPVAYTARLPCLHRLRKVEGLIIPDDYNHRSLSNGIKIQVHSSHVKFIQFVTRIVPDMYEIQSGGVVQWDQELQSVEGNYMKNLEEPRWKVDTAGETCFYDDSGLSLSTHNYAAIYDCPGGAVEVHQERALFCTFAVVGDKVTHKIKWSRQFDEADREFYAVEIEKCESLPSWAIRTILEDPWCTTTETTAVVYPLSRNLASSLDQNASLDDLRLEARRDCLAPPANWMTFVNHPELFNSLDNNQRLQPTRQ